MKQTLVFLAIISTLVSCGLKQARAEMPDNSSNAIGTYLDTDGMDLEPGECNSQDDSGCTQEQWDAANGGEE